MSDNSDNTAGTTRGKLCRIFTESARLGGEFTIRDTGITVSEILTSLDEVGQARTIFKFGGKITERDISLCQTIAAHYLEDRPEYQQNGPNAQVRIFMDENVQHRLIPLLLTQNARLAHISFHNLTTKTDQEIWEFAKREGFNVFITQDSDFIHLIEQEVLARLQKTGSFGKTSIADLPLVVKIDASARSIAAAERSLKAHMETIIRQASNPQRRVAWGELTNSHFKAGRHIEEVYHSYVRPSIQGTRLFEPAFDERILDFKHINRVRETFDLEPLKFTKKRGWKLFYDRAYAEKKAEEEREDTSTRKNPSPRPS